MADPFAVAGDPYFGGDPFGRGSSASAPAQPHHFWDDIPGSKIAANTVKDLEGVAVHLPSGLYDAGKAVVSDVKHGNLNNTKQLGKAMLVSTLHDLEHPLRHPGYTLLDLWGVTSGLGEAAARAGAVGKALSEGGSLADVGKAALVKPPAPIRYVEGAQALYSRNPVVRQAQKLVDASRMRFPVLSPEAKAGRELTANRRVTDALDKTLGNKLMSLSRKLSAPEHVALRVVAEGKPISERIAYHESQLPGASFFSKRAHTAQVKLLGQGRKFVDETSGVPKIKPEFPKLQQTYDLAKSAAMERERVLREMGFLKETNRVSAPGQVIEGSFQPAHDASGIPGQLTIEDALREGGVPEHVFQGGEFRVPYAADSAPLSMFRNPTFRGGIPRTPATLTNRFEGGLLRSGQYRNDTAQLVAESYMEAERFASLLRARDHLVNLAQDSPEGIDPRYAVPIRLDALKGKAFPQAVRAFLSQPEEHMAREGSLEHWRMFGTAYDALRNEIFPSKQELAQHDIAGVKWIDRRLLGGLDKPNPLIGFTSYGAVRKGMDIFDAINNASRLAILYLKPAYAVPNLFGNAAMNIVQQGFAAPVNLARAARLSKTLGADAAVIDSLMGEGFVRAISGHEGLGSQLVNRAAEFWSRGVDVPFRRSSFLYEANRAGFKTGQAIRDLLHDSANQERLIDVVRRANREIIDYAELNPVEREIIRRVVFFYPWVKGATKYAGRFIGEHPFKAAAAGAVGQHGAEQDALDLGELPSWDEGLFKVGGSPSSPLVSNASAAAIFQTPADVIETAKEALTGNVTAAHDLASYLSPVGAAELAALSRTSGTGRQYPPSTPPLAIFGQELTGGLPAVTLAKRLEGHQAASSHYSVAQALANYLLSGSLTPHQANLAVLHQQAARERSGR